LIDACSLFFGLAPRFDAVCFMVSLARRIGAGWTVTRRFGAGRPFL